MKSIRVFLTEQCNANCHNCINKTSRGSSFMDVEKFQLMCQYFAKNNIKGIRIMGGEPTLHPNFNLLIQIAQEHFEMVSIFTNAINNKIQTISLREKDGINYNFRFYSYLSSDKLLLDQPGYRALEVLISVDGDIEAIFNNIQKIVSDHVSKFIVLLTLDCTSNLFENRDILIQKFEHLYQLCNNWGIKVSLDHSIPVCFIYGSKIPIFEKGAMCNTNCAGLIDSNFNLRFCNQHSNILISLFSEDGRIIPFPIIENNINLVYYQNQITALTKICKDCVFFNKICNGGCYITNDRVTREDIIQNTELPLM